MSEQTGPTSELAPEQDVRPCQHMEGMVSGYADGSLRGPAHWYTRLHIVYCRQCRAAVKNLRALIRKLSDLRSNDAARNARLPAGRRSEIERALDEVDASLHE